MSENSDSIQRLTEMKKMKERVATFIRPSIPRTAMQVHMWNTAYNIDLDIKALEIAIAALKAQGE